MKTKKIKFMKKMIFFVVLLASMLAAQLVNAQSVTITTNPSPAVICAGQGTVVSLTANATGGIAMAYAWSNGGVNQSINVSPTSTTTYTVTVTFMGGATATANQTVTVNPAPTATITPAGSTTICQGDSVNLSCSAADTYQWYRNGSLLSGATSQTYWASLAGNYTVAITIGNCVALSGPTTITVNPLPVAAFTPNNQGQGYCPNSGLLTATTGVGYTYQWLWSATQTGPWVNAPGASTGTTYVPQTTGYHALRTTLNGCSAVTNY